MHLLRIESHGGFSSPFFIALLLLLVVIFYFFSDKNKPKKTKRSYARRTPVNNKVDVHIHK
jgi:hypothetical protein